MHHQPDRRRTLQVAIVIAVTALWFLPVVAGAFWIGPGETSLTVKLKGTYDSNLLKYSLYDRQRFENGTEAYWMTPANNHHWLSHRSPIKSLDDLRYDLRIGGEWRRIKKTRPVTVVNLDLNLARHASDPVKDVEWFGIGVRQELTKKWFLAGSYFYEPDYYIRDFADKQTQTIQQCRYAVDQTKAQLTFRPRMAIEGTLNGTYKRYRYNKYFDEFDGNAVGLGGELVFRPGAWRLEAGYRFWSFENTGYSRGIGLTADTTGDSEYGQADYDEDVFSASARYDYAVERYESRLRLGFDLNNRYYTTGRSISLDPFHFGRHDLVTSWELTNAIDWNDAFSTEVGYSWNHRDATSNNASVARLKSYYRWTTWLELIYRIE